MSRRFFTADTHIGHLLLASLRGFPSIEAHDEAIVTRWNEIVSPSDTVFVAGDVALGIQRTTLRTLARMNGTKHLVSGNHDSCHPSHSNAWVHLPEYVKYFRSIQPFMRINMDGTTVLISHFPYTPDPRRPRLNQYRLPDVGNWLLHGHTHSPQRMTGPREIHIGMDAWGLTPVPESQIITLMRNQLKKEKDHHASDQHTPRPRPSTRHAAGAALAADADTSAQPGTESEPGSGTA